VKSAEDIRRLQDAYATPAFLSARSLALTFRTDPEVARELIPPPLAPAADPVCSVAVFEIGRSNCVGGFNGGSINVACRYNGQDGLYCITMPMDTDTAVIFGRELYAEPKKVAAVALEIGPRFARGVVTRHGIPYIELTGDFPEPLAEVNREGTSRHYYFKYLPACDGRGLAGDPQLVQVTHRGTTHRLAQGTGTIIFRESAHDPVIDIPVLEILSASLSESETHTRAEVVATVPATDFLPYAYGKIDDLTVWAGALSVAGSR
jgi:acetoacetate decarboxylase